jgi:sphinganine C4-monooxygenase
MIDMFNWETHRIEMLLIFLPPIVYWTYGSLFHLLDVMDLSTVSKYRINKLESREKNPVSPTQVILGVLLQQLLQALLSIISLSLGANDPWMGEVSWWGSVIQFIVAMLIVDSWQYWWHRYMHENKWLYRHIHSYHHRLNITYAYGALYNHPIEGFILDTIGGTVAVILSGMSMNVALLFICLSTMKTIDDHSGYRFPFDPFYMMFRNNAKYHDYHHKIPTHNFSQPYFTLWDLYCGTDHDMKVSHDFNLSKKKL